MYKLPKPVLIFIFLVFLSLLFFVIKLIRLNYGAKIELLEEEFYLIFGIVSFVSCITGICFIFTFKSWTVEELVDRMDNPIKINSTIIALQARKIQLKSEIPDHVRVVIESHEIKSKK